jgi:hypothetical protein
MKIGLIVSLFACSVVFAETNLLKSRTWTSTEGTGLEAELIHLHDDRIAIKRKKDGKNIDLPLERLSLDDKEILEKACLSIDEAAEKSVLRRYQSVLFVGLPDPSEKTWELSKRLGKHQVLWEAITQSGWRDNESSQRLVTLMPRSIRRELDNRYLVMGEYVAIRFEAPAPYKINISGDKLVIIDQNGSQATLAERGKSFAPVARKENLISCDLEQIGVSETLVFTIRAR